MTSQHYGHIEARLDNIDAEVEDLANRTLSVAIEQHRIAQRIAVLEKSLVNRNETTERVLAAARRITIRWNQTEEVE